VGKEAILDPSASRIAGELARYVFNTSKDGFLNKLFVFDVFRLKFQNPEKLEAKNMFF